MYTYVSFSLTIDDKPMTIPKTCLPVHCRHSSLFDVKEARIFLHPGAVPTTLQHTSFPLQSLDFELCAQSQCWLQKEILHSNVSLCKTFEPRSNPVLRRSADSHCLRCRAGEMVFLCRWRCWYSDWTAGLWRSAKLLEGLKNEAVSWLRLVTNWAWNLRKMASTIADRLLSNCKQSKMKATDHLFLKITAPQPWHTKHDTI